jgi:hypothetical protein
MIMGYVTEYIIHLKQDISKIKFLNDLTSLGQIDKENKNIISYQGYEFYIYLQKIYNNQSEKSYLVIKIYLQEDNDENENIEEIDRLSKIEEIDFSDNEKYRKKFKYFLKLQGIIKNLFRKKEQMGYIQEIECIRDDYSFILLKKAYPIIYEIENLMRKLIVKLMYFNASENWQKTEIPDKINISQDREKLHILGSDFAHLADMLFVPIENNNQELYTYIKEVSSQKIDYNYLKKLVPKSNWDKYFSNLVTNTTDKELKKLLENLRLIRNKVAHNRIQIEYNFYENLIEYSDDIIKMILNAIVKLDRDVQKTAKEKIINKLSHSKNIPYKRFFRYFCILENRLFKYYKKEFNIKNIPEDFIFKLKNKFANNIGDNIYIKKSIDLMFFKNDLIYENTESNKREIRQNIEKIKEILKNIDKLPKIKNEEVYQNFDLIEED